MYIYSQNQNKIEKNLWESKNIQYVFSIFNHCPEMITVQEISCHSDSSCFTMVFHFISFHPMAKNPPFLRLGKCYEKEFNLLNTCSKNQPICNTCIFQCWFLRVNFSLLRIPLEHIVQRTTPIYVYLVANIVLRLCAQVKPQICGRCDFMLFKTKPF